MKKTLLPLATLILVFTPSVFAKNSVTNIVKVLGFTEITLSSGEDAGYSFDVKTPKGDINIFLGNEEEARLNKNLDPKSAKILNDAYKTKSCVKITESAREIKGIYHFKITVQEVACPKKLPEIKHLYL